MADFTAAEIAKLETVAADFDRRRRPSVARLIRRVIRRVRPPNDPRGDSESLTTTQVAEILRVSDQTVRNWADLKWLPAYRAHPLARRQIPASAVLRLEEFRRQAAVIPAEKRLTDEEAVALVAKRRARKAGQPALAGLSR